MKFEDAEEAAQAIANACEFFGWELAILGNEDSDTEVPGMILGTKEYINDVLDGKYKDVPKDEDASSKA